MIRRPGPARADWQERLAEIGLDYHSGGLEPEPGLDGGLWWHESDHWELTETEVDTLDDATAGLHALCLAAVDHLVRREPHRLRAEFGMAEWMADYVCRSWLRGDPALMGRMDLAWNPASGTPLLLEYNADTPTLAIETALAQWFWLQTVHPRADQFNSLHEALLDGFRALAVRMNGRSMHFAAFRDAPEEWAHSTYFRDLAEQAGIATQPIGIPDIRWNDAAGEFRDAAENRIQFLHKLYPWEWAATDEFGPFFARDTLGVVEPPWKAVLSHKAILPLLWQLNPGHPNLLEAHRGAAPSTGDWVEKPALGREGPNIRMLRDGRPVASTEGSYGNAAIISQRRAPMLVQDGWTVVIGSWIAHDKACGVIFASPATSSCARTAGCCPICSARRSGPGIGSFQSMTVSKTRTIKSRMKAFDLTIALTIAALPLACRAQPAESAMVTKAGEIESRLGARVGLAVYDTERDTSWLYHADDRFPLTSTFKAFACADLLHRVDSGQTALDRTVRISQSDLVPYAPVMEHLVGQDVSLQNVCAAALRLSDNVAGNKVLDSIGGPTGLTEYMRSIGDTVTRLDRREPELNEANPGDRRDTTTPAAIAKSLRRLVLGDALSASSRQQLTAWLVADEVGGPLLRASLPTAWRIADRTGAGGHGSRGIIAVIWPPGRAPIVAAIFLTGTDATMDQRNGSMAELGAALVADVTKQNR